MTVNWEKIIGRAAIYAAATPKHPVTIKNSVVEALRIINPDIYDSVSEKIRSGAYIVE